ncbi:imidazole glycerol phosphate synthase subunit HisH [Propionispira raffinosivorans]|uniref:imidazole glycerol phosphate synthase subunit HisH n=1 Tax=Propionispira raffinosivorans TaxID=86959 RepID=UPI00035FC2F5|nr:imidazole glycerol phosphate synthase subunit HisH [Propionispira raffinosivorans]
MIAIIDYGVGNLFSVEKAFVKLGADVIVTSDAEEIAKADKIVLPGVGAFGDCMQNLIESGLIPTILDAVATGKPFLGICVGLQILFEGSEESPGIAGLGIIKGMVKKIYAPALKIPHMGWNSLELAAASPLFHSLPKSPYVYFVHSYYAVPEDPSVITAITEYGQQVTAAVAQKNIQATQFHPEKSGDIGLLILKNFIKSV